MIKSYLKRKIKNKYSECLIEEHIMENDMKKIEITEKNVKAAFKAAKSDEVKEVLAELFYTPENKLENKPNLDDYTTIKSYEDACEALDLTPIYSDKNAKRAICQHINEHWDFRQALPKHIIALLKLETISRALWGKDFQPKPDAEGSTWYYYPWFALYTKKEIEGMTEKNKGALCLRVRIMVRLLGSVVWMRLIVPRMRLRTLGSVCARKQKKRHYTLGSNSLNYGLNIWHSISQLEKG